MAAEDPKRYACTPSKGITARTSRSPCASRTRASSRAASTRGPGFNVRVVTIADDFPAKADLEALLRAYVAAWPKTADAVRRGFEKVVTDKPRAKAHLVKRGLWTILRRVRSECRTGGTDGR